MNSENKQTRNKDKPLNLLKKRQRNQNEASHSTNDERGFGRGRDNRDREFNRDFNANDESNGFSGGYKPSEDGEGRMSRGGYGGPCGSFRGGHRGGFRNEESGEGEGERPRRFHERHSGSGRGSEFKRDGAGRGNWGTPADEISPETDGHLFREPEPEEMTLEEYEKLLEDKRKTLKALKTEERKVVVDKEFQSMQPLASKKSNDEIFAKLVRNQRKEAAEKEEKAKKSMSINEFLKPTEGGRYYNPSGRGRGRGRGLRPGHGFNNPSSNVPAPKIADAGEEHQHEGGLSSNLPSKHSKKRQHEEVGGEQAQEEALLNSAKHYTKTLQKEPIGVLPKSSEELENSQAGLESGSRISARNKMKNTSKNLILVDTRNKNKHEASVNLQAKDSTKRRQEDFVGVPSQEEADQPFDESATDLPPPKRRGPTRMNHIWELQEGIKIQVQLGLKGLPVGYEACALTRFIGSMVRRPNLAPISHPSWRDMSNNDKKAMWAACKSKFEFVPKRRKTTKKWVMGQANDKWKKWKCELKSKGFDDTRTIDEMYEKINDNRVDRGQFEVLANYWLSDEGKALSIQNKKNREHHGEPHCTGTKTYSRLIDEMAKAADGVYPSRADVYIVSRTRTNGKVVNKRAKAVMAQLNNLKNQSGVSEALDITPLQEDILSKVKGPDKKGKVRCFGPMPTSQKSDKTTCNPNKQIATVLSGFLEMWKRRFPDENGADILQTALQLGEEVMAGQTHGAGRASTSSPQTSHESAHSRTVPDQSIGR